MTALTDTTNPLDRRRIPRLLAIATAFLVGVLLTALVTPDRDEIVQAAGPGSVAPGVSQPVAGGETGPGVDGASAAGAAGSPAAAPSAAGQPSPAAGPSAGVPTGSGGDPGPASGPSQTTVPGTGGATAPGVEADTITIGFGIPDLGAIGALGPGYDQGNPEQHVLAILAQLREEGRLPVHGRDIKPAFSSYNILSADEQRATCEFFGNDVKVFAVIAIHDFADGNECTAREFGLPTFTSDGLSDAVMARSAPNMFTMQMSTDRLLRNYARWADEAGFLDGKTIGVYSSNDPEAAKSVKDNLINPLKALGHNVEVEVQTSQTEASTGGPNDSIAVQQFQTNRVEVAILLVSAVAKTNFFNQAEGQGYRPLYLENDIGFSTTDTATSTYPANHFDQTPAFTGMRFGEGNSGVAEPAEAQWCRDAIRKQSGNDIPRQGRDAEYIASNQACDEILTVMTGLEHAGPHLTRPAFIAGVETIVDRVTGIHGNITFAPGRHDGVSRWRQIRWHATCTCWKVDGDLRPLFTD